MASSRDRTAVAPSTRCHVAATPSTWPSEGLRGSTLSFPRRREHDPVQRRISPVSDDKNAEPPLLAGGPGQDQSGEFYRHTKWARGAAARRDRLYQCESAYLHLDGCRSASLHAFLASRRVRAVASRDLGTAALVSAQTRTRRPSDTHERVERQTPRPRRERPRVEAQLEPCWPRRSSSRCPNWRRRRASSSSSPRP